MTRLPLPLVLILAALVVPACGKKSPFCELAPDETVVLPGLGREVEVLRDAHGVPHIYCTEDLDCIAAQGYVQAHDRFFEMDLFRNYGKGTLGVLFGANPAVRSVDRATRRVMTDPVDGRHVAEHILESLEAGDPETLATLEAFASGVNAYLAQMGQSARAPTPGEYDFGLILDGAQMPAPWTPLDTLAIGRLFSMMLSDEFDAQLAGAKMAAKLDAQTLADLFPSAPMDPTFALPDFYGSGALGRGWKPSAALLSRMRAAAPVIDLALEARRGPEALRRLFGPEPGSNNWIVSAKHSASGQVMVANDPHLSLWSPAVWHEAQLDAVTLPKARGTLRVQGVAFPGTPGVVIGHNASIAWAVTTVGYDVSDLYVETVSGVDKVRFKGADVAVQKIIVNFPRGPLASDGFDEEKLCIVPHHGPLWSAEGSSAKELADPKTPCVDPARGAQALSGRWTGMEPSNELTAFLDLSRAGSVAEAKRAWLGFEVGAQNLLVGDVAGDILYFPHARVPIRDGDLAANPPWLPLPGEGGYEWTGDIPAEDLPQVENPPGGVIVTANNDIAGVTADGNPVNDARYLFYTRDLGLRAGRITRRLDAALAKGPVTLEETRAIQTDTRSDLASLFVPHLLGAASARADLVQSLGLASAIGRLTAWGFDQPTGLAGHALDAPPSDDLATRDAAIATSIFAAWFFHAIEDTFQDELSAADPTFGRLVAPESQARQKALFFALESGKGTYFDDLGTPETETREEILLGALREALDELTAALGPDESAWLWGRRHHARLLSIFGVFGVPNEFDLGPIPQPGGFHTINVAGFSRAYQTTHGASVRMITLLDPAGPSSDQIIPGGVIDLLDHPNRSDQLIPWIEGRTKIVSDDPEEILRAAIERQAAGLRPGGRTLFTPAG